MKKLYGLFVVLLVSILVVGIHPAAAKTIILRYAHVGIEGESQTIWGQQVTDLINKRTEGRVTVQVFPNSGRGEIR